MLPTEPPDPGPVLVLLAAGRGSRMGGPKWLLDHGGQPWITRQVQAFRLAGGRQVLVVVAPRDHEDARVLLGLPADPAGSSGGIDGIALCLNPRPERGMFSSVSCALALLEGREVLIQPVDVPLPEPELLLRLLGDGLDARDCLQPGSGQRRGHPLRLGTDLVSRLASLDPGMDRRLDHEVRRLARCCRLLPTPSALPFLNLNTPADWQEYLSLFPPRV